MILNDRQIERYAKEGMIDPFTPNQENGGGTKISYGLSSFGYDVRLGKRFKLFHNTDGHFVDPKSPSNVLLDREADTIVIPPNSYVLGETMEYFNIPEDVVVLGIGKSTYARCGLLVNVTPLEPGWRGVVTLEIANGTPVGAKVYAGEGICQLLFLKGDRPRITYADRKGKYQDQTGVTAARLSAVA
jgi:dCTP deaminase